MLYRWVFTVVSASELCPPEAGETRTPHVIVKLINFDGEEVQVVNSQPSTGTEPVWNFISFSLPAKELHNKYSAIKFKIMDGQKYLGNSKIKWEFIGEPPKEKNYTLRISDIQKKDPTIRGLLKVYTQFVEVEEEGEGEGEDTTDPQVDQVEEEEEDEEETSQKVSYRRSQLLAKKISKQGSFRQVNGKLQLHTTRVQFSSSGRREIHIPTSGADKFKIYGELPTMELLDYKPRAFKKKPGGEKYGFNLNNALWLVTCATLAYKSEDVIYDVCRNVWDMESFMYFSNPETDTFGFCMYNEKFLVICFKGTETVKDWMTNLQFVLIPGRFPERYIQEGLRVHQGFHNALLGVWDQIESFLDEAFSAHPKLRLYICGHSLGGALANICHAFLTLNDTPRSVSAVYTIGQPRVGNRKFKQFLDVANPNTPYIRLTNNMDVVPSLAAGQHVGTHVHINATKNLDFNPKAWVKATNEIQALHQGGKDLSYHGLDDHSGPVYLRIIEELWSRSFALNSKNTNLFSLAESTLLIIDMLMTSLQGVLRYKAQFRSLIAPIIKFKPIIDSISDYTLIMDPTQEDKAISFLKKLNQLLAQLHQEVIIRLKEKSILVRRARHESEFNTKMQQIGAQMQTAIEGMHDLLTILNSSFTDVAEQFGFHIQKYDHTAFAIDLNSIDYEKLSADANAILTEREKNQQAGISTMIDSAEQIMSEGDLERALAFLEQMPQTDNFKRYMNNEQKIHLAFLTAKCHAKLKHHNEAMKALQEIVGLDTETEGLIHDQEFADFKNDKEFNSIVTTPQKAPAEYEKRLNENEIDQLGSLFEEYNKTGDGYLTSKEFDLMIIEIGAQNLLFQLGWANLQAIPQILKITNTINTEYGGSVDIEIFLNLMATLIPKEMQTKSSATIERLKKVSAGSSGSIKRLKKVGAESSGSIKRLKNKVNTGSCGSIKRLKKKGSSSAPSSLKDKQSASAGDIKRNPKGRHRKGFVSTCPPKLADMPPYVSGSGKYRIGKPPLNLSTLPSNPTDMPGYMSGFSEQKE